jgi:cbb3-type cytochrome oxidase subunit 3
MIKSIKGIMGSVDGIEIYPILSLLMFFVFFTILAWYVFSRDKKHIDKMKQIPLENDNEQL